MKKDELKKQIASSAYNIGFGAKVGYSSYDVLRLAPGVISFLSVATGITGLIWEPASSKPISAAFLILGILGIYISSKLSGKEDLEISARKLNDYFHDLRILYATVSSHEGDPEESHIQEFHDITVNSREFRIADPLFLSSWIAHQKFFGETQSQWVVEELDLKFWKDKVPSSFKYTTFTVLTLIVAGLIIRHFWICP